MGNFMLGKRSLGELVRVDPRLCEATKLGLHYSPVDFGVLDGLRTIEEQRQYVQTGVSQTMNSKHLPQDDGTSHAVDLVPYINGKFRWEWPPIFLIAEAMRRGAQEVGIELKWGGSWSNLTITTMSPEKMREAYIALRRQQGRKWFSDGPHYELI